MICPERPRKVNARIAEREDSRCRAGQSHETRVRRAGPEASPRLPARALPMRVSPALWGLHNPRKAARSVCLVCQASLVTSRVSSSVSSVLSAKQTQIKMQPNAFYARQAVQPMSRGVPSAHSAQPDNTAMSKETSARNVQKAFIAAHQTRILKDAWLVQSAK